jgi:hypothetical protein
MVGVTLIVLTIGAAVPFVPIKEGKPPVPLVARPIAALEFVHANVAPAGTLVKGVAGIVVPPQTAMLVTGLTTGLGLTVIVNVNGRPGHGFPAIVGVTVMVEVMGELVGFVVMNEGSPPIPLAASPIAVFEFVQV